MVRLRVTNSGDIFFFSFLKQKRFFQVFVYILSIYSSFSSIFCSCCGFYTSEEGKRDRSEEKAETTSSNPSVS